MGFLNNVQNPYVQAAYQKYASGTANTNPQSGALNTTGFQNTSQASGQDALNNISTQQATFDQAMRTYPFGNVYEGSGLYNLRFDANGVPDTSNLSPKEISKLWNLMNGAYDKLNQVPVNQRMQLIADAQEQKIKDLGDYVRKPYEDLILKGSLSPLYDQIKNETRSMDAAGNDTGIRSKDMYQKAFDTTLHPLMRLAYLLRGNEKRALLKQFRQNIKDVMTKFQQEDPEAEAQRQKLEEQANRIARSAGGSEDGSDG